MSQRRITKLGHARSRRVQELRKIARAKREVFECMLRFGKTGLVIGFTAICLILMVVSYTLGAYNTHQDVTVACIEKNQLHIRYTNSTLQCNPVTYKGYKFNASLYMLQKQEEYLNRR